MANANKIEINTPEGKETLIDLTGDGVTPETLDEGVTAHDASGAPITGTRSVDVVRYGAQTLTEEQKAQARANIDAAKPSDIPTITAVKSALPKLTMVGTDANGVEHTWTIYGS